MTNLDIVSIMISRGRLNRKGVDFQNDAIGWLDADDEETVRFAKWRVAKGYWKPDVVSVLGEMLAAIW